MPLLFAPTLNVGQNEGVIYDIQNDTDFVSADTDTSRVEWQLNQYENEGFERWDTPNRPDELSTYRTTEHFTGFSTSNFTEGTRSCVMQARAMNVDYPATAELRPSSWSWSPTSWSNLTISFDWIIDSLPDSTDGDYFRLEIRLGNPGSKYLRYYLGCEVTGVTNSTSYHYFMIDAAPTGWNTFDRNITADFETMTNGAIPTEFERIEFNLEAVSTSYSRVYFDDLNVVNGTNVRISGSTNNGNFETSTFWYRPNGDPADIGQCTDRVEGDFSLNATTISNGNSSSCQVNSRPYKRLSSTNVDSFKFQWRMDDFAVATDDTYAFVYVSCKNDTEEFYLYYPICYGGYEFPETYEGYQYINATGFNTTGQWHQFDRSIWNDITSVNSTSFLVV
jgi:hypothetical protein